MLGDEILAMNDAQIEKVSIPEWGPLGEQIFVRVMTGAERDRWEAGIMTLNGDAAAFYNGVRARLAQLTACDAAGKLIFKPEHVDALGQKTSTALQRIYEAALRLNKLGKSDVEELRKNSAAGQSGASGSASPATSESQSVNVSEKLTARSSQSGSLITN